MHISIVDAAALPAEGRQQMAEILTAAFVRWPNAWPTLAEAQEELEEFAGAIAAGGDSARIWRAALDDDGRVLGWIGGLPEYDGLVWELHPLAVDPGLQRRGIGRALVLDFEQRVAERGGLTIQLGSDDESNLTSLGGQDLFPRPLEKLLQIENLHDHPYSFYLKLGYEFIGVVPDANGFGKPDIIMGKRVAA
ncbi:MAG: GNAT family N-acetyltransferase [Anaerolineales bacterium]|nr:GNAT family N-acetyltransferase [Anaerolineales bacterium]